MNNILFEPPHHNGPCTNCYVPIMCMYNDWILCQDRDKSNKGELYGMSEYALL